MNAPAPGPIFDVIAVLNGMVDLRSYPRRHLVLSSPQTGGFVFGSADYQRAIFEPVVHLVNGIELLESQGWELVSVVERNIENVYYTIAFMRRA
ncbi:hypothetical protein [Nocardia suismassiliense]|uniref:hypothetical protein n=1 Tax=Nocardia suismassiliense TaxID=2077092 RepID=UPI00131F0C18|nr:hypothetical protein [Nocardia suismassiliense]